MSSTYTISTPDLLTAADPPFLDLVLPGNLEDPTFLEFVTVCRKNDIVSASQLLHKQEPAGLTWGLNQALHSLHLDVPRYLLLSGAMWDAYTVVYASRSLDSLKLLFEFGYHVDTGLMGGETMLRKVVQQNNEPGIRFVLEQGANPNLGPPWYPSGDTFQIRPLRDSGFVLNSAASKCTPEIFALLLEHGAVLSNSIPLHFAAAGSEGAPPGERIPMLEYLYGLGLDIHRTDDTLKISDDGRAQKGFPLMYAVVWGRLEEARWLLEHGADPDRETPWGSSARDIVMRGSVRGKMSSLFDDFAPAP